MCTGIRSEVSRFLTTDSADVNSCSMERTGSLWDTGAVDITGSLMVIVLKQVAIAHNISDGHSKRAATFTDERRSLLLESPPSLLHYLSFMYSFGNLLVGPFNEYADYSAFMDRSGPWKPAFAPGMMAPALTASGKCIVQGIALLIVHLGLSAYFSPMILTAPRVWELSMLQRYLIAFAIGAVLQAQGCSHRAHAASISPCCDPPFVLETDQIVLGNPCTRQDCLRFNRRFP